MLIYITHRRQSL